jgi:hypothetical protein
MLQEMFKDAKGEIRNRISKRERQHNGQKIKGKRTNNDLQNITQKTNDRATRSESSCTGRVCCSNYLMILTIFLQEMTTSTPTEETFA